jgi:hypothetical protein
MTEAMWSSETSHLTRTTRRNIRIDEILHSYRCEALKFYIALPAGLCIEDVYVSPVRYEVGFYIPEDAILHGHSRENLKSYIALTGWTL